MGPGRLVRLYYKKGREYDRIIEGLGILSDETIKLCYGIGTVSVCERV